MDFQVFHSLLSHLAPEAVLGTPCWQDKSQKERGKYKPMILVSIEQTLHFLSFDKLKALENDWPYSRVVDPRGAALQLHPAF